MPARIMGNPVFDFAVAIAGLGRFRKSALRRLQRGLDRRDEARGVVTVDDPVIDRDRQVHQVANLDCRCERPALADLCTPRIATSG